jgi:hypothetical protein
MLCPLDKLKPPSLRRGEKRREMRFLRVNSAQNNEQEGTYNKKSHANQGSQQPSDQQPSDAKND